MSIATFASSMFAVDAAGCYDVRWFIKTPEIREQKQKQTECGVKMGLLHDGDVLPCQLHSHAELQSVNAKLLGKNNWRNFMVMICFWLRVDERQSCISLLLNWIRIWTQRQRRDISVWLRFLLSAGSIFI